MSRQLDTSPADSARPAHLSLDDFARLAPARTGHLTLPQVKYLLGFSLMAPTAHNTVPQLYRVDKNGRFVDVLLNRRYVLTASDATGRQALSSVGCAIENYTRAAAQYGLIVEWTPNPALQAVDLKGSDSSSAILLGRLTVGTRTQPPSKEARHAALCALDERRVVRTEFSTEHCLPQELGARLVACAAQLPEVSLSLCTSANEKFAWGKLDESAMKFTLEKRAFRTELGRWLLDNGDRASSRGMRGREFGLSDQETSRLIAQLSGTSRLPGDGLAMMARAGRAALSTSSAVCALSTVQQRPSASIDIGRAFQRCGLLAWQENLALSVHTAICEVPHIRAMCRATLMRGTLGPSLIFRLGVPLHTNNQVPARSSRPPLNEVLAVTHIAP